MAGEKKPTSDEFLAASIGKAAIASAKSFAEIQRSADLIVACVEQKAKEVAASGKRISGKIQDGSRLTKHRFTP